MPINSEMMATCGEQASVVFEPPRPARIAWLKRVSLSAKAILELPGAIKLGSLTMHGF